MTHPNSIFSLNAAAVEEGDINEKCPSCKIPFSAHTNSQLVSCALIELKGGN